MYEGALRSIGGGCLADGMRFTFRLDLAPLLYRASAFGQIQISCECTVRASAVRDCDSPTKDSDRVGDFSFRRELPGREFRYERVSSEGVFVDRLIANRAQDWQKDAAADEHGGDGSETGIHGGVAGAKEGSGGAVRVGKAFKSARRRMKEIGEWMYGDDPIM